jgi:hypothetical protein
MEPKLMCSQEPASGSYPEPVHNFSTYYCKDPF